MAIVVLLLFLAAAAAAAAVTDDDAAVVLAPLDDVLRWEGVVLRRVVGELRADSGDGVLRLGSVTC